MAGTPTPNYNFPTYAETDVPDLAGAYNQAVNAIDAKIKEVADTIPSDVDVPDANSTTKGIAKLYDSSSIGDSTQEDGGVTPAAMKDYVDEKVPTEQQAYTGTAPIVVDNGSHAISVSDAGRTMYDAQSGFTVGSRGVIPSGRVTEPDVFNAIVNDMDATNWNEASKSLPSSYVVSTAIKQATPDASTSVKGLVQLAADYTYNDQSKAATGAAISNAFGQLAGSWPSLVSKATTPLSTEMLANLYVAPNGIVVYKAPSE